MAQFFTDFSDYPTGAPPADWTERWILGGQVLEVAEDAGGTGGKVLRHRITEDNRRAFSWEAVPGSSNVEIVARVRASDADARLGIIARGSGEGHVRDNEYGFTTELEPGRYTADRRPDDEADEPQHTTRSYDARMARTPERPHGTGKQDGMTTFPFELGEFHWLRLRAVEGEQGVDVYAKAWSGAAEDEPADWAHVRENSESADVGAGGWVGITGQGTSGIREYDLVGVGTDGDEAPTRPV
jgi:hypothetical protein